MRCGLGLLLALLAAAGCGGSGPKGSIGSPAAEFSLTALDGSAVRLEDYAGRIVVLDFWATWCRPCQLEIPHFIALEAEYGPRGLAVIGVAVNDREDNVRVFAERMQINYPTALGNDGLVQAYGGFNAIPTTFIIGPDGKIAARYTGYQDKQVFADVIEKLLPAVRQTD
jgi:peroxiredoxin